MRSAGGDEERNEEAREPMDDRSEPATGVLVGVDDDPATRTAVEWAAREASRRHIPLEIVQVLPGAGRGAALRVPTGRPHDLLDRARRHAERVAPGVATRMSVVEGRVGPNLVAVAERAALLVVGVRGPVLDLDPVVGRTVAHVLGHAACPVAVVPHHGRDEDGPVLVGIDGSADAAAAVGLAAEIAERDQDPLVALGVMPRVGARDDDDRWRRIVAEGVAGIAEDHPDLPVHEDVVHGTADQELVRRAGGARLVVLGSRGRGALTGALLGSTSQAVAGRASCPVVVLPPRAATARAHRTRTGAGRSA